MGTPEIVGWNSSRMNVKEVRWEIGTTLSKVTNTVYKAQCYNVTKEKGQRNCYVITIELKTDSQICNLMNFAVTI